MFRLRHNLKIARIIVGFVMINVMNNFPGQKWAPEHFFSNDAVFMTATMLSISRCYTIKFFALRVAVVHSSATGLFFRS